MPEAVKKVEADVLKKKFVNIMELRLALAALSDGKVEKISLYELLMFIKSLTEDEDGV